MPGPSLRFALVLAVASAGSATGGGALVAVGGAFVAVGGAFVAVGDAGRGRGLGNRSGAKAATPYPKPAPLPSTPSPTLATVEPVVVAQSEGLGYEAQVNGATAYPKPADDRPPLPEDLVADFASFAEAWGYLDQVKIDFVAGLSRDRATGRFKVLLWVIRQTAGTPKIRLEKLLGALGLDRDKRNRSRTEETVTNALDFLKELGVVKGWKIEPHKKTGEPMVVVTKAADWHYPSDQEDEDPDLDLD